MNFDELKILFESKTDNYVRQELHKEKVDDRLLIKPYYDMLHVGFIQFKKHFYLEIINKKVLKIFKDVEKETENRLSFFLKTDDKIKAIENYLLQAKEEYEDSEIHKYYSIENFYNEIFSKKSIAEIWVTILTTNIEFCARWKDDGLQDEFNITIRNKDCLELKRGFENSCLNTVKTIKLLLSIHLSKEIYKNLNNFNYTVKTKNPYPLVFQSLYAYNFFIYCFENFKKSYNSFGDTKLSQMLYLFQEEKLIREKCNVEYQNFLQSESIKKNVRLRDDFGSKVLDKMKTNILQLKKNFEEGKQIR